MAITRYDPFARLNQLQRELNQLFDRTLPAMEEEGSPVIASEWMPAVDIREESDRYIIAMDLPGINPNDVEINMENGVLSIKGERKFEKKTNRKTTAVLNGPAGCSSVGLSCPIWPMPIKSARLTKTGCWKLSFLNRKKRNRRKSPSRLDYSSSSWAALSRPFFLLRGWHCSCTAKRC